MEEKVMLEVMDLQNLDDGLFEKDDSAYIDADKMTRPSLTYLSLIHIFGFSCTASRRSDFSVSHGRICIFFLASLS